MRRALIQPKPAVDPVPSGPVDRPGVETPPTASSLQCVRPSGRSRGHGTRTEMFFVEAAYPRSPDRAAGQVRYIAHPEEGLTAGRRRELYGIGQRYRALRAEEPAIRQALREDARGLRNPA